MDFERKVPTGRLGRVARLAAAGVKAGAGRVMGKATAEGGAELAEMLGTLRGLAAKAGQMAAYVDGLVPEDRRDAYQLGMKALFMAAPRSSAAQIHQRIQEELRAPVAELFTSFDDVPLASASIGQVHRARLKDGREVVVKVQHPGIHEAVESDLANLGVIESALTLTPARKFEPERLFEELRARFREELDYRLEGQRQEEFRLFHHGDPTIRVPAVVLEHTTERVLVAELARGLDFDRACLATPGEREAWARTLWRFVYKGNVIGGMFNADPHPGNYLFGPDGQVTFLDFGCIQRLDEPRRLRALAIRRAAVARDRASFEREVVALMDAGEGEHRARVLRQFSDIYRPVFESPFHITRPWAAGLLHQMRELNKASRDARDEEYRPLPSGLLFFNRLQFGFYSVLARLDVPVDYAAVEREWLP